MAGYRGKYWNVGMQDRSQLGATDAQLRYLRSIYNKDFRGTGLTQGQASDLIDQGLDERTKRGHHLTTMADQIFSGLMKRAIDAANAAGEEWLKKHPDPQFVIITQEGPIHVHAPVGHVHITAPKRGSGLAKWMEEHGFNDRRNPKELSLQHRYTDRLEGDLVLKCAIAAIEVLRETQAENGDIRLVYRCDDENFKLTA